PSSVRHLPHRSACRPARHGRENPGSYSCGLPQHSVCSRTLQSGLSHTASFALMSAWLPRFCSCYHLLSCQCDFERSGIVAHQSHRSEDAPKLNDRSKHPVFAPNRSHGAFVLSAVGEEAGCAAEALASHGQLDLRCLLNIAHPLTVDIRAADEE